MLGRFEDLALFVPDMRVEPLAELFKQRWGDRVRTPEYAKSGVVLANSVCK
jgi:hypothetical protein